MEQMLKLAGTAFVPAGLIAAAFFALAWVWRPNSRVPWDAIGIFAGFTWGFLTFNQIWLPQPAKGAIHWLPIALAFGVAFGIGLKNREQTLKVVLGLVSLAMLGAIASKIPAAYPNWSGAKLIFATGGSAFLVAALTLRVFQAPKAKLPAWDTFLVFGLLCAASVPAFFIAGSSKWAQVLGAAGVCCIPGFLLAVWKRPVELSLVGTFVLQLVFWAMTVYVFFFTDYLPLAALFLLTIPAPLALQVVGMLDFAHRPKARAILYSLVAILGALAVWLADHAVPDAGDWY